jgi:hypothetical protein
LNRRLPYALFKMHHGYDRAGIRKAPADWQGLSFLLV